MMILDWKSEHISPDYWILTQWLFCPFTRRWQYCTCSKCKCNWDTMLLFYASDVIHFISIGIKCQVYTNIHTEIDNLQLQQTLSHTHLTYEHTMVVCKFVRFMGSMWFIVLAFWNNTIDTGETPATF